MKHATAAQMAKAYRAIAQEHSAEFLATLSRAEYNALLRATVETMFPGRTA